ncbi:MAG TPA: 30S ribosomal protein S13 [Candidatus Pacearchaeota archaeon]|nr:30S ribosomal protein S13 [Candidatus Pacearchaeota archaeon]HOK94260.1 30S ribosomal protein S13 [Candidatus Pacearchaeota archaeon]HPO75374.1 30S ribosomal protein S13 [Candidatus Pacearchaeota archaeon]
MPRIAGVNIPENKKILYSLPYIYGIGLSLAKKILTEANIDFEKRAKDLTAEEVDRLKNIVEKKYKVEGELRREEMMNIKRLKEIGSWRGQRHARKLPVRGQRTRCNSRTVRGNVRRTVGSGHKPPPAPK